MSYKKSWNKSRKQFAKLQTINKKIFRLTSLLPPPTPREQFIGLHGIPAPKNRKTKYETFMSEVINIKELNERIERESVFVDTLRTEMGKVIVGQTHLVDTLLIGLLSNGHILLEGVPGLAKTLAITTLAKAVDACFSRIQFTKTRWSRRAPTRCPRRRWTVSCSKPKSRTPRNRRSAISCA